MFAPGFLAAGFFAAGMFAAADVVDVVQVEAPKLSSSAGGAGSDAGVGYVRREHGWVKLTKMVRVGAEAHMAMPSVRNFALGGMVRTKARTAEAGVEVRTQRIEKNKRAIAGTCAHYAAARVGARVTAEARVAAGTRAKACQIDWISADELAIIIGEMEAEGVG